ncbi:2-hydroxyacid dehydrogenase [Pontibacter sp. CAU 1760]
MSIMIFSQRKDVSPWVNALKEKRPDVPVRVYPDGEENEGVTFALAWNHPLGAFQEFPNLKCISSMGAGADHILKDPTIPADVTITRIKDINLTRDMGAFVLSLVLNHLRGLAAYKDKQQANIWKPRRYTRPEEVTVGIMGMGELGGHVARLMRQLGCKVCGWATSRKAIEGMQVFAGPTELSAFLAQTDILVCLLPLTPDTANILNKDTLSQLPKGAFLINVARGEHLVEEDLLELLETGHLSGASLDVFRQEPLPAGHPFWSHPRISITPHIASITDPGSVVEQVLENYDRLQAGQPLQNIVSRTKGY